MTRQSDYDRARSLCLAGFYERGTETLRTCPENYCLAHRGEDGRWTMYPHEGMTRAFRPAGEAILARRQDSMTPEALADMLSAAFAQSRSIVKRAVRRDPTVPMGQPAPLHVVCGCGTKVHLVPPLDSRCPECGTTYDARGWVQP